MGRGSICCNSCNATEPSRCIPSLEDAAALCPPKNNKLRLCFDSVQFHCIQLHYITFQNQINELMMLMNKIIVHKNIDFSSSSSSHFFVVFFSTRIPIPLRGTSTQHEMHYCICYFSVDDDDGDNDDYHDDGNCSNSSNNKNGYMIFCYYNKHILSLGQPVHYTSIVCKPKRRWWSLPLA